MRVRGRRRCRDCGTEWSYFETGDPACPACESLRSVSVDGDRTLHTDSPAQLDLSTARAKLDDRPLREVAAAAERAARSYLATRGFVRAGELQSIDGSVLAAAELRAVAGELRRGLTPTDDAAAHFLALLDAAADGRRPSDVPPSLRAARGLAVATTVGDFRRDLTKVIEDRPDDVDPEVRSLLDRLRTHEHRIEAVDGDVPEAEAEALVAAANAIGEHVRAGSASALETARARLEAIETG